MTEFTLPLNDNDPRPIVHLDWNNINALWATGTSLPIWIGTEDALVATGATVVREKVSVGSTYGNAEGKLYEIHDFKLDRLSYPILHIVCSPAPDFAPCQMLMGNVMFEGLTVGVNGPERTLTIEVDDDSTVRNVLVKDGHAVCEIVQ